MLELTNIRKDYPAGDGKVQALKGVSLQFRKSEFVAILGPSGCGKTTMLNIIGGLDQYTEGDLVINGTSTKHYKDRDWDAYRNHSIGFVFQSYNLIPHQTVLQNVELALTLSGVSKAERRKRAIQVLKDVGLADQLRKKPAQMSGGQMQRVAIARALVNNPDIILADEPTGALDTETSVQVMDILKEVAKDRLVIMVTHNPDLAEKYATRTIKMLDGCITSDSMPLTETELAELQEEKPKEKKKKEKKPSMSWATSFGLSLKNLISKKSRTLLTSFAGSIGIIGIALIYAVSSGMTTYIDTVQEDTLSSYPLTLRASEMNMSSLMATFVGNAQSGAPHENDAVYEKNMMQDLVDALSTMEETTNDLKSFKVHLEKIVNDPEHALNGAVNGVQYTYQLPLTVYTQNVDGQIIQSDSQVLMQELMLEFMGMDLSAMMDLSASYGVDSASMASMMSGGMAGSDIVWQELLTGKNGETINPLLQKQYDLIYGAWPNDYNEVVLVVDENNEIDDMTLYAMGLKSKAEIEALANAVLEQTTVERTDRKWSYQEVCGRTFRVVLPSNCYSHDETTDTWVDLRDTQAGLRYLYDNGLDLKVVGVIRINEEAVSGMLSGTLCYTADLTKHIIAQTADSAAVQAQKADPETDIFTDLPFRASTGAMTEEEKVAVFTDFVATLDEKGKADTYVKVMSTLTQTQVDAMVEEQLGGMTRQDLEAMMLQAMEGQVSISVDEMTQYITAMEEEELFEMAGQLMGEQIRVQYAQQVQAQMAQLDTATLAMGLDLAMPAVTDAQIKMKAAAFAQNVPPQQLAGMTEADMCTAYEAAQPPFTQEQLATFHDQVLRFSETTYEENLIKLGCVELDSPATINIYASTFEDKDLIEAEITAYNESVDEIHQIRYTDYVGLIMSSVTTIINAITYVLIAFVAISLVVSSIMIGVITLISVQERTKEIGILRAIGASKRNVSSMFNAETIMIGFASGVIGVGMTWLLCLPINAIIFALTDIAGLKAALPWEVAVILVAISVLLTSLAGVIPARSAAKKDPVVALRTE